MDLAGIEVDVNTTYNVNAGTLAIDVELFGLPFYLSRSLHNYIQYVCHQHTLALVTVDKIELIRSDVKATVEALIFGLEKSDTRKAAIKWHKLGS